MSYSYKVLSAAVEQRLQFPSRESYDAFIAKLTAKDEPFEVLSCTEHVAGFLTVVIRRRYNNNEFLASHDGHCSSCGLFEPIDFQTGFCYCWQRTIDRGGFCHEWIERGPDDV